jgi:DNA-binding transcriptional LysR family regulator
MDTKALAWLIEASRAGSMSAVARKLGVAVSTVARRLDALEADLRLRLVDRKPNGLVLTAEGVRIVALAEPLMVAAERIGRAAKVLRDGGTGIAVTVSATEFVTAEVLAPRLHRLFDERRPLAVTLRPQTANVSLAGRDADLAIRMARPEGNSLIARKLPTFRLGLFASAEYLRGRDAETLRLGDERLLAYDDSYGPIPEVTWIEREGLSDAVGMRSGSTHALISGAVAGAGIALLPAYYAKQLGLVEVRSSLIPGSRTPWLIVHRDLRRVPEIASVHRWIVHCFAQVEATRAVINGAPAPRRSPAPRPASPGA